MQVAGSPSWRFAEGGDQLVSVALFVRDAVGLMVPTARDNPPPLARPVPSRTAVLGESDRAVAGGQWLGWWRRILAERAARGSGGQREAADSRAWAQELIADMQRLADPPTFSSLADRPQLQTAVRATFEEACRWEAALFDPETRRLGHFGWATVKQMAEDVAFDRRVGLDAIDGTVVVVDVEGPWWVRIVPGMVLCSPRAAADPRTAQLILRDVFESRLVA